MADNKFSFYESQESVQVFQTSSVVDEVEITSLDVSEEDEFIVEEEKIELGSVVFFNAVSQDNDNNNAPLLTEPSKDSVNNADRICCSQPEEVDEELRNDCVLMMTEPIKNNVDHSDKISGEQQEEVAEEARNDIDVSASDTSDEEKRPSDNGRSVEVNCKEETGPSEQQLHIIAEITSKASNSSLSRNLTTSSSGESLTSIQKTPSLVAGVGAIDNIRSLLKNELMRGEFLW